MCKAKAKYINKQVFENQSIMKKKIIPNITQSIL